MHNEIERYSAVTEFDSKPQTEPVRSSKKTVTLIYGGHVYHRQIDQFPPSNHLNRTLMYRGYVCYPRSASTPPAESKIVSLIYLGHTYYRAIPQARIYRQPRAINWRWQISSEN